MASLANDGQNLSALISKSEIAKPIVRVEPKYPDRDARRGNTGWVTVNFVVDKYGATQDITVEEHSFRGKAFAASAIKAVDKWRYKPMMVNGEAVESCQNSVQFRFNFNKLTFTKRTKILIQKWLNAINQNDLTNMEVYKEKVRAIKQLNSMELAWFYYAHASHYKALRQPEQEYQYTRKLSYKYNQQHFTSEAMLKLLFDNYFLAIDHNKFKHVERTYSSIVENFDKQFPKQVNMIREHQQKVERFLASNKPISINTKLTENGTWYHELNRNNFSITNIEGELTKLDVRCANKRHTYTIEQDNLWKIPNSWGECKILVEGDIGSKFTIVETNIKSS